MWRHPLSFVYPSLDSVDSLDSNSLHISHIAHFNAPSSYIITIDLRIIFVSYFHAFKGEPVSAL